MRIKLGEFFYYGWWFVRARVFGVRQPLVGGINITSYCNLSCAHCVYAAQPIPREHLTRAQIDGMMATFKRQGIRTLFLQGGEPTLWRDGDYTFNDLVCDAKKQFAHVACVTNAILPIDNPCDLVWISVDGSPEVHDRVRGAGSYAKMARNVAEAKNENLYANITLSRLNVEDLEACVEHIRSEMPRFKAISINFEIPYPGVEEHTLSYEQRAAAVERIIALRRKGYPILNSASSLHLMLRPGWNTTHWLISLAHPNGMVVEGCGARLVDPEICKSCGYGVMAEVQALWRGDPRAILDAFRLMSIVGS
jgi:Fe-coproporphyrin III synthase